MRNKISFTLGLVVGIVLCLGFLLLVLVSGTINVAATTKPGPLESTLAPLAVDHSRERRAPNETDPYTNSAAVATGLDHYRKNCVVCHGAPNVEAGELPTGLNPPAPELQSPDTQAMSDGELFWTIKHGVRMTGMPALEPSHTDEQIWKIVSFVRHLPKLTPNEAAALRVGHKSDEPQKE